MIKKNSLLILMIFFSVLNLTAQPHIGIAGGVNFQNINGKDDSGVTLDNGLLVGFHGGVNIIVPVAADLYVQTGLLYTTKGSKNDFGSVTLKSTYTFTTTTRLSYIEMPLNVLFRPQMGKGHLMLGFGPYLAVAVGAYQKTDAQYISLEPEIVFSNSITEAEYLSVTEAYYRRMDAGAGLFFGYELSMGLFFQVNAQLGLLKINPEVTDTDRYKTTYRNAGFGLSTGFRF